MFKRFLAILLVLLMLPVGLLAPLAAHAMTSTMDLNQDFIATAGSLTTGGDSVYSFSGAGTNLYNNLSSVSSYSGDITLQFDVKFESTASDQMMMFTARNPKSLDQTGNALLSGMDATDVRSNFVLHTSPYGLRLGKDGGGSNQVKDTNDAMNVAGKADISIWYTVYYSIEGTTHTVKYWATDAGSEESPAVTLTYTDPNNRTEGYIAFSKRGTGAVQLRNVSINGSAALDLMDPTVFSGNAGCVEKLGYEFYGAAKDGNNHQYNKMASVESYSGDITLQFDVKFSSKEDAERFVVTPRANLTSTDAGPSVFNSTDTVTAGFVLLHNEECGLRLGTVTNSTYSMPNKDTSLGSTSDVDISCWYTVKYEVVGNKHTIKYWKSDTESEEAAVSLSDTDTSGATSGKVVFSKRGTGSVQLRNISVTQKTEATVTFKVVNGTWSDGTTADKTVQIPMTDSTGTLASTQIPVDMIPNAGYDIGYWETTPDTIENGITGDVTYSYIFKQKPQGINLTDSSLFNYYGKDPIVQIGDEVYLFYGQNKTDDVFTYNKVVSKQAYGGNITMSFDVKFNATDSDNMLFFSAKASPKTDDVNASAPFSLNTDVYANIVLHLKISSYGKDNENVNGLRISKAGVSACKDNTLCEYQLDDISLTGTWFTVKYVIENDVHKMKIWPANETEPQEWAIEYNDTNVAFSGYMSFVKRGAGYVELRNVTYAGTPLNETSLFSVETVPTVAGNVGMSVTDLDLPATVDGTLLNGNSVTMNIAWDTSTMNLTNPGTHTINGTLVMPQGTDNNGNISVSTTVNVLPEGQVFYRSWIFQQGEEGLEEITTFHQFGTMTTMNGTVLAYCEARAVTSNDAGQPMHAVLKRSTDGGKTWGPVILVGDYRKNLCSENENKVTENGQDYVGHCYANPTMVQDADTGRIFCFLSCNHGNSTTDLFYCYSDDDGQTWTDLVNITSLFANDGDDSNGPDDPYNRGFHLPGPGHGIQLKYGQYAGRLIVEVWHRHARSYGNNEEVEFGLSVLYSDDHGETWANGNYTSVYGDRKSTVYGCNEGRIAELADGTLVINSRSIYNWRRYLCSTDGGVTWSEPVNWASIGSYSNCDSGFVTYVDDLTDTTTMLTTHIRSDSASGVTGRTNLQAYLSYDNGQTWNYTRELWRNTEGGTGASDVNLLDAETGTYGVIHGTTWADNDAEYIVFNTAWLINNNDSTVTLEGGAFGAYGAGSYPVGAAVTINAGYKEGYTFAGWTTDSGITLADASAPATTFTMPDSAVTIVASWNANTSSIEVVIDDYTSETAGVTLTDPADG